MSKIKENKTKKAIKYAIALLILFVMSIITSKAINAWSGTLTSGMPAAVSNGITGYLPQFIPGVGAIYCNDQNSMIRFGSKDYEKHYASIEDYESNDNNRNLIYSGVNDPQLINRLYAFAKGQAVSTAGPNYTEVETHYENRLTIGTIDPTKPLVAIIDEGADGTIAANSQRAFSAARSAVERKLAELGREELPLELSGNALDIYNGHNQYVPYNGDPNSGPQVAVMGSGDHSQYNQVGDTVSIDTRNDNSFENIMNAYIYTGQFHASRERVNAYTQLDIQVANWLQNDHKGNSHGYNADGTGTQTLTQGINQTNGIKLYQEAKQYYKFLQELKANGGYKATVNTQNLQVFVSRDDSNRNNDEYIIGPVSITYPYYENISYMTDIVLETSGENGNTILSYKNGDFYIVLQSQGGNRFTGGNTFPTNGETFFVILNASRANYPENINIVGNFEYTDYCRTEYYELQARPYIYTYKGYLNVGNVTYFLKIKWTEIEMVDGPTWHWETDENGNDIKVFDQVRIEVEMEEMITVKATLLQTYVKMDVDNPNTDDVGQDLRSVANSYIPSGAIEIPDIDVGQKTYAHKTTATASAQIDLEIRLGGKVWVDGRAGKESNYDGQFLANTDTPMSNVRVVLHQRNPQGNESVKAETRTDRNGNYEFSGLNPLYTYYVEFVYNGQYYEPTIYKADNVSWANSSKGTDIIAQRQTFNAKFAEIGSNPQSYLGGQVYTREQLTNMGAIDEFGNSTGSNRYANDCMMSSYTGYNQNGNFYREYYPVYSKFVIDDFINRGNNLVTDTSGRSISSYNILYGGAYNNLNVNQGYVLRETVDIAIRKDVYQATLEINGKTETYTYDKREGLEEDSNGNSYWQISTRISDRYYDTTYSRELYREDYDYKTQNYINLTEQERANLGISQNDELKIFVTYKVTLRNLSETVLTTVTEVVDYYDQEYTFEGNRSYIGDRNGNKVANVSASTSSKYGVATETNLSGYEKIYIRGENGSDLPQSNPGNNKDVYLYLTFSVDKDSARNVILDEEVSTGNAVGVGKENIVEINGYKTHYGPESKAPNSSNNKTTTEYTNGDIAGIADVNSIPGNLNSNDIQKDGTIRFENFENDTDKAPNIKIILNRTNVRTTQGVVWEDRRNVTNNNAQVGDGIRQTENDGETGVNGVRVQLVELITGNDGRTYEYIWKEVNSGDKSSITPIINNNGLVPNYNIENDGQYRFESFVPGNYIVRFIYGDGTSSVLGTASTNYETGETQENPITNAMDSIEGYNKTTENQGYVAANGENIGLNEKSYNGQDFKSTSYQSGVESNGQSAYNDNTTTSYVYDFAAADEGLYSDAKDIMTVNRNIANIAANQAYLTNISNSRENVENYSKENVTNTKAQILAAYETMPSNSTNMKEYLNQFMTNTYMVAESGTMAVQVEYNRNGSATANDGNDNIGNSNYDRSGYYVINNLDFGLVERPKAQLKTTKQVTNVQVTLANGTVLFDASGRATNVLWQPDVAHNPDTSNTYKINNNYTTNNISRDRNFMLIPSVRTAGNKGVIQLTMDEELMHGATVKITYAIFVANIGEVDYDENQFYYTGRVADTNTIVKTTPNQLIDYVGYKVESGDAQTVKRNNQQFALADNNGWEAKTVSELRQSDLISAEIEENAAKYTTIIVTNDSSTIDNKALVPIRVNESEAEEIEKILRDDPLNVAEQITNNTNIQSVAATKLILTQMITSDNSTDDMQYNNLVELVKTSNTVGRKMEYSIVGNQDPTREPTEIDADDTVNVTILPPFGQKYIYYILGSAVALILVVGIIFVIRITKKRK